FLAQLGYFTGRSVHEFDAEGVGLLKRQGDFRAEKVAILHVSNVSGGVRAPLAHRVRVFAGVLFDGARSAAVGVTFAQYRVYGAAFHFVVTRLDVFLFSGLRIFRVIRQRVAFGL